MDNIKCITFDKQAQDALPESVNAKMKLSRERAMNGWKQQQCPNCKEMSWINPDNKDGIINDFCEFCEHPIWE